MRFAVIQLAAYPAVSDDPHLFRPPLAQLIGRNRIYLVTCLLNLLLAIPQALSPNMTGILASRWFQGMCSSVGNSMVGGTIAGACRPRRVALPTALTEQLTLCWRLQICSTQRSAVGP